MFAARLLLERDAYTTFGQPSHGAGRDSNELNTHLLNEGGEWFVSNSVPGELYGVGQSSSCIPGFTSQESSVECFLISHKCLMSS